MQWFRVAGRWVQGVLLVAMAGCAAAPRGLAAGQGSAGPWWMQQTALTNDGRIDLTSRPWWGQAVGLKVGEESVIAGSPQGMLVRREMIRLRGGQEREAIVWIIDDDGDGGGPAGRPGDTDSDCTVVDYAGDGIIDRMVDYIDDDGDDDPDEMDIRYFVDGELRQVWVGVDLDDDNRMWDLAGYEYSGNFFRSDPHGNSMIYMNKFDPQHGRWVPISECPFAFYDTDGDGYSEVVVRASAVPLGYDLAADPDYANDARRYQGPWRPEMQRMGIVNVRYSFDVDNLSGPATPLHYDFGFNLVGAAPYEFPRIEHNNPRRRPPQVTRVVPHGDLRRIADEYRATETGFTWHEQHDDTIAIGDGDLKEMDARWEGVFWIWERRLMGNTGGPGQKWNVRREWSRRPADRRELYFSAVDRRIHLFGAEEGWIQVGHFAGQPELGEVRMYDTDGNGYFDRWEVYAADEPVPLRVSTVRDERAERLTFEDARLSRFYVDEVLPEAMAANGRVMSVMREVWPFDAPAGLLAAIDAGSANTRRFAQDVVREMHYQALRQHFTRKAHEVIRQARMDDLRPLKPGQLSTTPNSHYAWRLLRTLETLDVAYGQGDVDGACAALRELSVVEASVKP